MKIDWIDDKLGITTTIDNYNDLVDVNAVFNVRGEYHDDIYELTKRGIAYYWIPIPNWLPPTKGQIDTFLKVVKDSKGKIIVHCEYGIGRSGVLVIAYLIENKIVNTLEEAFKYMKDLGHPVDEMWIAQHDKLRKHYGKSG